MSELTSTIVSKVWGMCGPLRDDGVSYGDYLEQITYLIFLKILQIFYKCFEFITKIITSIINYTRHVIC